MRLHVRCVFSAMRRSIRNRAPTFDTRLGKLHCSNNKFQASIQCSLRYTLEHILGPSPKRTADLSLAVSGLPSGSYDLFKPNKLVHQPPQPYLVPCLVTLYIPRFCRDRFLLTGSDRSRATAIRTLDSAHGATITMMVRSSAYQLCSVSAEWKGLLCLCLASLRQ